MPGGIDPHTHLDMPFGGTITADDFETGRAARRLGGTTTVVDFALHTRGDSLHNALKTWHGKADGKAVIDYAFHLTIADGRDETMAEIPKIIEEQGVNSFKVFMAYKHVLQVDDETIFKTLQACAKAGGLVQVHAENGDVIEVITKEALAAGHTEPKWHALTRPVECEGEATHRAIRLAEIAGAPLYVVHVSSAMAADAISDGRKRGLPIYGETCPQYLVCDSSDYERPNFEGAKYVLSPPIRDKWNQGVLLRKLKNMELHAFGSDHCSFNLCGQKDLGKDNFSKIPNGAPTIEDRLAILWDVGVNGGADRVRISSSRSASTNPAKLFGLFPAQGDDRGRQRRRRGRVGSQRLADDLGEDASHERRQQRLRRIARSKAGRGMYSRAARRSPRGTRLPAARVTGNSSAAPSSSPFNFSEERDRGK